MPAITPSPAIELPDDIYDRVLGFAVELTKQRQTDAGGADSGTYAALRDYCESLAGQGLDHPVLWETLADFTIDDHTAIALYRRALDAAEQRGAADLDGAIHLALAMRYQAVGEVELAYAQAMRADAIAKDKQDLAVRREVSQFLLTRSINP